MGIHLEDGNAQLLNDLRGKAATIVKTNFGFLKYK